MGGMSKERGVSGMTLERIWCARASHEPRVLAEGVVDGGGTTVAPPPTCQLVRKVPGCRWLLFGVYFWSKRMVC